MDRTIHHSTGLERWLPGLVGVVLAVLVAWSVLPAPWRVAVGHPVSPCHDHLWGLWVTAQGLLGAGPFVRDAPDVAFPFGFTAMLYEPVNLVLFLPGYWLGGGGSAGAALGWNALHLGWLAIAVGGCWLLARELLGDVEGATVASAALVAVFAGNAWALGHPLMGHSEYLAAAGWPLHAWALLRFLRTGRWSLAVLAGVLLGAMASSASYMPVFLGLLEVPLALLLARESGRARGVVLVRLVAVAGLALLTAAPFAWALLADRSAGQGAFAGQDAVQGRPAVELSGVLAGLTRLWPGRPPIRMNEQPVYPGLVASALAVVGVLSTPRRAGPWALLGGAGVLLGLGTAVAVGGASIALPAGWLTSAVPPLGAVHWWERLGCLTPLPVGIAALFGVRSLAARVRRTDLRMAVGLALPALLIADQATWPRAHPTLPTPGFHTSAPAELVEHLDGVGGAVLQLPLPLNLPGPPVGTGRYLLWQRVHRHPVSTTQTLLGDTSLEYSYLSRVVGNRQAALAGRVPRGASLAGASGVLDGDERACVVADTAALRRMGFGAVVLDTRLGRGEELEALLVGALGAPDRSGQTHRTWLLASSASHQPCPLPEAAPPILTLLRLMGPQRRGGPPPQ